MKCVFFDFDGTLTDVEHHAPLYEEAFREELSRRAGATRATLDAAWQTAAGEVKASPELGWTMGGHVVAPAGADPYLFASAVAGLVLARIGGLDAAARGVAMYEAYRAAYRRVPTRFREEAAEVIDALVARGLVVCVVTNAFADDVAAKLDALPLRPASRAALDVRGDARKFEIGPPAAADARFAALARETRIEGLARPVLLGRGRYFDVLRGLWDEHATGPEATLVCGDVYELDLALPAALGAHVQLVVHSRTLAHERAAVETLARGAVGTSLTAVLDRVSA